MTIRNQLEFKLVVTVPEELSDKLETRHKVLEALRNSRECMNVVMREFVHEDAHWYFIAEKQKRRK